MPWSLILTIGLKFINMFIRNKERKDKLHKDFLKFVKTHDQDAFNSLKMHKDYQDILKKIKEEDANT